MIRSPQWSCLRKGGLVIILILILNIMSIVSRLHGFKVIMLMFLLFAFDLVCIWSKQIVNTFCKSSNQQLKNKTPFHKWSSSKFQSRPVSCQILRLSLSLEAPSLAGWNYALRLSESLHLASTCGRAGTAWGVSTHTDEQCKFVAGTSRWVSGASGG